MIASAELDQESLSPYTAPLNALSISTDPTTSIIPVKKNVTFAAAALEDPVPATSAEVESISTSSESKLMVVKCEIETVRFRHSSVALALW